MAGGVAPARRPPAFTPKSAAWRIWRARQNMSGYSLSCSRADSSILLAAQWAAALSMMPASAPSCWAQGVTAASYNEYAIWSPPGLGFHETDDKPSQAADAGYCAALRIGMCDLRNERTRLIVRALSSGGSRHGKTVISALGASDATSIEVCSGCD